MSKQEILNQLLELSHFLGEEDRDLAILGEGNTSAKINESSFFVKASGSCLQTLAADSLVACKFETLLPMLEQEELSDSQIEEYLMASRVDPDGKKPSVETLFHAYLLSLPGVNFVGHTHSIPINQILCSPLADVFAARKMFPDDVVCCGVESVLIPYVDPGLPLSQQIKERTSAFIEKYQAPPRVILLANHGIITLGKTSGAVKAAMLMAHKAARIFVGAAMLGGPVFMSDEGVDRIANRSDEHYRQRALNL